MPAAIEVNGLVKEFKKGPRAVDGIDLRVEPGEIYGFLGPNGAGKSTTVHMLTTLLPPTAGTARVAGYDVVERGRRGARAHRRRAAGGRARPVPHRRASTCACRPRCTGCRATERERRGDELIERVGLAEAADRKVGGYSGGMKRRLDLALALVHRPRILFLDEPTTGPRPAEPQRAVGGGRAAGLRRGRDRLPDHPVPRGGRPPGRPRGDHRRRPDRRRGHARRAQGRDRRAQRRGRARRPAPTATGSPRCWPASATTATVRSARPRRWRVRLAGGDERPGRRRARARRRGRGGRAPAAARADARRRLPGQDRPLARGRGRGRRGGGRARRPPA